MFFFDLRTKSYQNIIDGHGFGLEEAKQLISIVHFIRNAETKLLQSDYHPLAKWTLNDHPF